MAVTDLTNTNWVIKAWPTISTSTDNTYSINFTANNISYTAFRLRNNGEYSYIYYNTTEVFDSDLGSWGDYEDYRTIEITGGTDATNASLISWLTANATQIPTATPKETFETNISALNDVLNEKAGTKGQHTIEQMITVADGISTGTDTSDANATAGDILLNKTAYVNGVKLTGSHVDKTETTRSVNLSMSSGNQVVTPSTNYVFTQVTIVKPATLIAENIKKDVTIAGVKGTLTPPSIVDNGDGTIDIVI